MQARVVSCRLKLEQIQARRLALDERMGALPEEYRLAAQRQLDESSRAIGEALAALEALPGALGRGAGVSPLALDTTGTPPRAGARESPVSSPPSEPAAAATPVSKEETPPEGMTKAQLMMWKKKQARKQKANGAKEIKTVCSVKRGSSVLQKRAAARKHQNTIDFIGVSSRPLAPLYATSISPRVSVAPWD